MEITLQKEKIAAYETLCRVQTETVAEGDAIVPDTKPDIAKILRTVGRVKIKGLEEKDHKINLWGEAAYTVLYAPEDGDEGAECMEIRLPFKDVCAVEDAAGAELFAEGEIVGTEVMVINSRKIALKGRISVSVEAARQKEIAFCIGAEADIPIELKKKTATFSARTGRGDFTVTCADKLEVPGENPPIHEILHAEAYVAEEDIRLITGKIILKGSIRVKTLYRSPLPEYPLSIMEHEIPFTEILDMPGAEEGMDYMLDYEITDIYMETEEEAGGARAFGCEITMAASAKTVMKRELEVPEDCFCPGFITEVKYETVPTEMLMDSVREEISLKKTVQIPSDLPAMERVCALYTKPCVSSVSVCGGAMEAEGNVEIHLLYRDEGGGVNAYTDKIPFQFSSPVKGDERCEIAVRVRPAGENYTLADTDSLEVRTLLVLEARLMGKGEISFVSEIAAKENEGEKKPSVVIAFTGRDDTLWSLAKKYGVCTKTIAAANGLAQGAPIKSGMRLLVPVR